MARTRLRCARFASALFITCVPRRIAPVIASQLTTFHQASRYRAGGSDISGNRRAPRRRSPAAVNASFIPGCPGWRGVISSVPAFTKQPGPAATEALDAASSNFVLKSAKEPKLAVMSSAARPWALRRRPSSELPEQGVVRVAAAVVAHGGANVFGHGCRCWRAALRRRLLQSACPSSALFRLVT